MNKWISTRAGQLNYFFGLFHFNPSLLMSIVQMRNPGPHENLFNNMPFRDQVDMRICGINLR